MVFRNTKNGDTRAVPLLPSLCGLLAARFECRHELDAAARPGVAAPPCREKVVGTVFPELPRSASCSFRKIRKRAGVADVRLHDLRHTFASRLVRKGVPLLLVSRLLGHRSLRMTERYSHFDTRQLIDAVSVLGEDLNESAHTPVSPTESSTSLTDDTSAQARGERDTGQGKSTVSGIAGEMPVQRDGCTDMALGGPMP